MPMARPTSRTAALACMDPKVNDLGHIRRSVFFGDIINDLTPPLIAKINIDIRHAFAARIQNRFEKKTIFNMVQISDPQEYNNPWTQTSYPRGTAAQGPTGTPMTLVNDNI